MGKIEKLAPSIQSVVREIFSRARVEGADQLAAWRKPQLDLSRLVHRDYVHSIRRHLAFRDLTTMLSSVNEILSRLGGDDPVMESARGMRTVASRFPLHFIASPYEGDDGLALRGFYIDQAFKTLERPLIYVNTAHVPLAVAVTFCHEFSHYLTAQLFKRRQKVHFFFDADYASHLDDPVELAADAMVSLRAYPRQIAERIFAREWNWGLVARAGDLSGAAFTKIRGHLRRNYGFNFSAAIPAGQNLHYLSGMIHYAKLRWALLAEYDL